MFSASAKRSLLVAVQRHSDARRLLEERGSARRPPDMMASTALEGALDIVAWPGYIERGETDKAYDWVSKFEAETGCKVTVKTAGTSDEMVSLMASGGAAAEPAGRCLLAAAGQRAVRPRHRVG